MSSAFQYHTTYSQPLFPNFWQPSSDVFIPDQAIYEPSPVVQVSSQPRERVSQALSVIPNAVEIPYPPPSDPCLCSSTSSTQDELDAPMPLRNQRRDPNHVPRPLNSFFLFKTDWLAKRKSLLADIEQDHRQLNRMASSEWRRLSPEAKQRFKDAAHKAKVEHAIKYPGYRFTPKSRRDRRKRKTKRNEPEILLRNEEAARLVSQGVTGDALREALAEYDRRCAEENRQSACRATSPLPFSDGQQSTPSASSPVTLTPSADVDQSHDWMAQPIFDLETQCDTLVGSPHPVPWARGASFSQHSPAVDRSRLVSAEPGRDLHLFHINDLLDNYASLFSQSHDPSTHAEHIRYQTDWGQHAVVPVGDTQGNVTFSACHPFETSSGFVQSTSDTSAASAYQNEALFQADVFLQSGSSMAWILPL
ncbi:hypothetical protein BJV78DRAFT_1373586 [Lactifluus subvellereus]|nr:hypothetical protein BJV78DRAFT_1373586 [Lactifluus subvellereus]